MERVAPVPGVAHALSFVAHLDVGDPNWDLVGTAWAYNGAAAIYNGGTGGMNSAKAQNYQNNFNSKNTQYQQLVNCMH